MPILLQINVTANWGSTGRIAEEIGQAVICEGWESLIAYGRNKNKSSSQLIRIGTNFDVYRHVLSTRLFDRNGLSSQGATKKFIKFIEVLKPDIIHLHNIHGYYLNYPILFKYLSESRIPVVWTLHDCWPFTGHCAYYDYVECDRWKRECHDCLQKKGFPASYMIDRSTKNYNEKKRWFRLVENITLVPVSDWLAAEVRKSFLGDISIRVIHNGIDPNVFSYTESGVKKKLGIDGKMVILGVASIWDRRKGLSDFLELRKILPLEEYVIILIGLDKRQIKLLPEGIIGVCRTNDIQELVEYYSMADVFVNPTWEDNFPTVNLEALSCGTPVITYRTGGSVEAIDGETGFVVEKGNVREIADCVHKVKQIGKQFYMRTCRRRVENFFDKKERYSEYLSLYKELLE